MATYEERAIIVRDAQITNPELYADDAAIQLVYPGTTRANAIAARDLLRRVQAGMVDVAAEQLELTPNADNRAAISWARNVTNSPEGEGLRVLRILMATFDAQTVAQILDPAVVTDTAIHNQIEALVPQLSLGAERP